MIRRTMDATFLNSVANHPDTRPWLGGAPEMAVDLTLLAQNPDNVFLEALGGGWWLQKLEPGTYELHSLFMPEGRGKSFFTGMKELFRYMFTRTDAVEILTKCPDNNGGARAAAGIVGFKERFRREDAWSPGVGISYRAFTVDDWMVRDKVALEAGRAFHAALEWAKSNAGSAIPSHPDDEANDRAAGAAWLMIDAGQTAKGVAIYNRWAVFAGYATILGVGPGIVDIRDAIVQVEGGETKVLLCR